MIKIIKAGLAEDFEAVRLLLSDYARIRNYDEAMGDYKSEINNIPGYYSLPNGCLLIAVDNRKIKGMVAFRKFDEQICEMKRMYVPKKFRGHKIGEMLLLKLIKCAKEQDYKKMYLDTHPWMETAQNLYKSYGFVECDPYHFNPTKGIKYFELKF